MKCVIVLYDGSRGNYITAQRVTVLHVSGDSRYCCSEIELNLSIQQADSLQFTIYRDNPSYATVDLNDLHVFMYRFDTELNASLRAQYMMFHGTIDEIDRDIEGTKKVHCTGILGVLDRVIQPQYKFQGTPADYLARLINVFNTYQGLTTNRFTVTAGSIDTTDDYILRYTNYESTLECIRRDIMESFGVYPKYTYTNNEIIPTLSFYTIENYGDLSNQVIRYGYNLIKYEENTEIDDLYTAVIPLGKKKTDAERTSTDIPALDAYVDIRSVNDGEIALTVPSIDTYGFKCAVVHWDDVTNPTNLKAKGQAWLQAAATKNLRFTLSAVDLSEMGVDINAFKVGDRVPCIVEQIGLDVVLPIYEMTLHPLEPEKDTITIGATAPSLVGGTHTASNTRADAASAETLSEIMKIVTYTCPYMVGGGLQAALTATDFGASTPSGYTPIGIQRIAAGNANMLIRAYNAKATGSSAIINLFNNSSTNVTATATVDIVYVKTEVLGT